MSDFSLTLFISVISVYVAMGAIFFTFYILRRERRRESDKTIPEANRWLENANTFKALGWEAASVVLAYNALEQTLHGIAKKFTFPEMPLSHLAYKLEQEKILQKEEVSSLQKVTEIRNMIVHGKAETISQDDLQFAFNFCIKITENLIIKKI